jgi:hypothetical protein
MALLGGWENFYVIVGSSAGALIGLTFVAVTLIGEARVRGARQGIDAFNTPTVVHFGAVLFAASLLSAPWPSLLPPAFILGVCGLAGLLYTVVVALRQLHMNRSTIYTPVMEDWLWYVACPFVTYAALMVAALLLTGDPAVALFAVGAVLVLLLFLGIHNAWDLVTYIAVEHLEQSDEQRERKAGTDETK